MPIRKEKLEYGKGDLKLKITLSDSSDFIGYQQEMNAISNELATAEINVVKDMEKRKYHLSSTLILSFLFTTGSTTSYTGATFTEFEISAQTKNFRNSFYIVDYYDDYDPNKQTKILSTYFTKLGDDTTYLITSDTEKQFYHWYVPEWYINQNTGSTVTGYTRFSFFNAKTGELCQFMNYDIQNSALSASTKLMYFKTEMDFENKTWNLIEGLSGNHYYARKLANSYYDDKINNGLNNIDYKEQHYPTGDTYSYTTNRYTGDTATQ